MKEICSSDGKKPLPISIHPRDSKERVSMLPGDPNIVLLGMNDVAILAPSSR